MTVAGAAHLREQRRGLRRCDDERRPRRESEKVEKADQYYAAERGYGSFSRAFTLPDGVLTDKIEAELKGGVSTLSIPERPEAQPKKINVAGK